MNKFHLLYIFYFFCLYACTQPSGSKNLTEKNIKIQKDFLEAKPGFKGNFENKISSLYDEFHLQGDFIIGIVNEHGLAYSYALNRDIVEGKSSSLNNDSPIYLASHSKAFTGTLLKVMEEQSVLDLNKTLHDYLPEATFDGSVDTKSITVKQLLNHTHGIHSNVLIWKTAFLGYESQQELIDALNTGYLFDSTHQFRYANTGPVIGAMIIDKITGNSWKEEMKKRIFEPLDMKRTSSNVSDYPPGEIRPSVWVNKDNQIYQTGFYKKDNTMCAAGGTISTINDLAKWVKFNINQETSILKNKESFKELHQATTSQKRAYFTYQRHGYSLGWDLATYQDMEMLTRFGGYSGISFHLSFIPEKKIGVIAFSSEERAAYLPHLAANYAYNLINGIPDAEDIFSEEKEMFADFYERVNEQPYPTEDKKLQISDKNDRLLGAYRNASGWPDIRISKDQSAYYMQWGSVDGVIYLTDNEEDPFVGSLGPLMRSFDVVGDSLFTGSLQYRKVSNFE